MNKKLNQKLQNILLENVTDTSEQIEDDILLIKPSEGEGSVEILFDKEEGKVIEFDNSSGELSFTPLSDFQPNVYGLSSDVFDNVEGEESLEDLSIVDIDEEEWEGPSYEEEKGFEDGRKFADTEDDVDFTEEEFEEIDDERLLEFAWKKGVEFTGRKNTIKRLFDHNKVNKENLKSFKEEVLKENINREVQKEVLDYGSDEFTEKYSKDLDFRDSSGTFSIDNLNPIYKKLDNLEEEEWKEYVSELESYGVCCEYDDLADEFKFSDCSPVKEEEIEEERFPLEESDKKTIKNILKNTTYTLLEVRGMKKSTKKDHMLEVVVEKDSHKEVIQYDDNKNQKPWSVKGKEFYTLQEGLNSITIPFKVLVNETLEASKSTVKREMLTEKIAKTYHNKTRGLPLAESEYRNERALELIKEMFENDVDENDPYLEEVKSYKKEND